MNAPELHRRDIEEQLEALYRTERRRHLVALHGTGVEETIDGKLSGRFRVVPVRSELDLRDRMPPLEDVEARVAFLVPWTGAVPLDLAGRFAHSGKVFRVGPELRLKQRFGVQEVEGAALRSPLADYLLRPGLATSYQVSGGRLTLALLWGAWLSSDWGLQVDDGSIALDALLTWAAADGRGLRFIEAMSAPEARGVRDALFAHLGSQLGGVGPAIWQAWESGRGRTALALAVLLEVLAANEHPGVRMWTRQRLRQELPALTDVDLPVATTALGRSAGTALRALERRAGPQEVRAVLKTADGLIDEPEVRDAAAESSWLPSAWRARLDRLGELLSRAATHPTSADVATAVGLLRKLEAHAFFKDREQTQPVARAEMAVRLVGWLLSQDSAEKANPIPPYAEAETFARRYAEEGGYVDWARRAARGPATDLLGAGAQAVVSRVDAIRLEMDRAFARGLRAWIDAGRPSSHILAIDEAIRRVAVPFLEPQQEQEQDRRLLVLLFDGMAWAQAVQLLQSLAQRAMPWGPIAWHATKRGKLGDGLHPVVLAALPTITEVSRAAFFAGALPEPGSRLSAEKDVERWQKNREVARFSSTVDTPRLLLRSEGHGLDGSASAEALSLVADTRRRVVAIVINAIDASLRRDPQEDHPWTVEFIRPLSDLLERAREAGRTVLMASDHGHVPSDVLQSVPAPPEGGARWRASASAVEPLADYEVSFGGDLVWRPKGTERVVLLADDAHRYGGAVRAGEHGGATLAEVVVPCLLLGAEDHADADAARVVRAPYVPPWWHFEVQIPSSSAGTQAPRPQKEAPTTERPLLPGVATSPASPELGRAAAFATCPVLLARAPGAHQRKQVVQAVEFLLDRDGVAAEAAFAAGMGVMPFRVSPLVAVLQEVLNVDGFEVLRYDRAAQQIYLERKRLCEQFEVKL